jgi:hypothetical protein
MLMFVQKVSLTTDEKKQIGDLDSMEISGALLESAWRDDAISRGVACYDSQTGAWQWRTDLHELLHDKRGWGLCPTCSGSGEIFIELEIESESAVDRRDLSTWFDPSVPVEGM